MSLSFGLWLYGWFNSERPYLVSVKANRGHSGQTEFFTGVLAVVGDALPPLMGVAMGYTLTQPWWITDGIFCAWTWARCSNAGVRHLPQLAGYLPRPGLNPIEAIFSFPIFATAIWLLWVLVRQTSSMF